MKGNSTHEAAITKLSVCVRPGGDLEWHADIAVGEEIELYEDENGKLQSRKVPQNP